MGLLTDMQGKIVGLDTAPLIYFIEKHKVYHPLLRPFFAALADGDFIVATSTITLVETLVHPIRTDHRELAQRYQEILLNAPHIIMYDLSPDIAQKAAEIRAEYSIHTPDAIQLATAVHAGAAFFLTNDRALLKFSPLKVLVVDDLT
ncbi:MAG TPA: type II toxin-antitoxin system VapC family toxin [Chloroflexi bacterium]|nr:type II toxin-antitoxin system VapC family toxin [Chloroflexota bacterium]